MGKMKNESFEIRRSVVGPYGNNVYVVVDGATGESAIIDPAAEPEKVLKLVEGTTVKYILFTHGHLDHVQALIPVRAATGAAVGVHQADASMLPRRPGIHLKDGDRIEIGETKIRVIHTPGHTEGGLCFLVEDQMIDGDTLFPGGPGKTSSPANFQKLIRSIEAKIYTLPDHVFLHPGHGEGITVGESKKEYQAFKGKERGGPLYGDVLWLS